MLHFGEHGHASTVIECHEIERTHVLIEEFLYRLMSFLCFFAGQADTSSGGRIVAQFEDLELAD